MGIAGSMAINSIGIDFIGIFIGCSMLSIGGSIISMPLFMAMGGREDLDG